MIRAFFIALIVAGLGVGIVYPWYLNHFSGSEIGRWIMQEARGAALRTPVVKLHEEDAPVRIFVDMTPLKDYTSSVHRSSLRLAVSRDGHPLLSEVLSYQKIDSDKLQSRSQDETIMRATAGDINRVITGNYTFSVVPADVDGLQVSKIELVLRRAAKPVNDNLISAGLIAIVLGVYGLVRGRLYRRRY